jgi:hypothetical protein
VEILGNASPFLLHDMLLLDTLPFPDLNFKFGRAPLDLAAKLGDPERRDSQDAA